MPTDKFYCGNCGNPLYYGRKFEEHAPLQPCPSCKTPNPISFHYCYRCGAKILLEERIEEIA